VVVGAEAVAVPRFLGSETCDCMTCDNAGNYYQENCATATTKTNKTTHLLSNSYMISISTRV